MNELKKGCGILDECFLKNLKFESFTNRQKFEAALLPKNTLYLSFDLKAYSHESYYFLENIQEIIESEQLDNVIINLKEVLWIDSTSISTLVNLRKLFSGSFCVYNITDDIEEIFEMLNLKNFINVYSDKYDAFEYISKYLN